MRAVALLFLVLFLAPAAPLAAQMKQWVDDNGVTHFEAHNTGTQLSPRMTEALPKGAPGKTDVRIERTHAGLTLGDNDSSPRNSKSWTSMGKDEFGGSGYVSTAALPPRATKLTALYTEGRLASINITYEESAFGGWKGAVDTMTTKYGAPYFNGYSEAKWRDGQTVLSLTKDFRGGLVALIIDAGAMQSYSKKSGRDGPKF